MTQEYQQRITDLIVKWQKILRLGHWIITPAIRELSAADRRGDVDMAYIDHVDDLCHAVITFIDEDSRNHCSKMFGTLEHDVVHELLHLLVKGTKTCHTELAINILTEALVSGGNWAERVNGVVDEINNTIGQNGKSEVSA